MWNWESLHAANSKICKKEVRSRESSHIVNATITLSLNAVTYVMSLGHSLKKLWLSSSSDIADIIGMIFVV
jgi:hypothetical protein